MITKDVRNGKKTTTRKPLLAQDYLFFASSNITLYHGDAVQVLELLPEASVDCIVTSPPYYGQRDYGVKKQIGLETHPQQYIQA